MRKLFYLLGVVCFAVLCAAPLLSRDEGQKVFSKRRDLPLHESASADSKTVAKADWNEPLSIISQEGKWVKVSARDGKGWVYVGNVSSEEIPKEGDKGRGGIGMTAAAAGRSLSPEVDKYAKEHDLDETAAQMKWAEEVNKGVTYERVCNYMKANNLGEYSKEK